MDNFERDYTRLIKELKGLSSFINERQVSLRLARKCREIIYRRVKSGYGVDNDKDDAANTNKITLKKLSKSYVDYRNGIVIFRKGKNGNVYAISNTEFTRVVRGATSRGRGKSGVGSSTKIGYKKEQTITPPKLGAFGRPGKSNLTLTGQMLDSMAIVADGVGFKLYIPATARVDADGNPSELTNKQVAEYVSLLGRPFLALTDGEVRILSQELELIIKEKINSIASRA